MKFQFHNASLTFNLSFFLLDEVRNKMSLLFTLNGIQYMLIVFLLLMLEGAVTVDVFLNHDWQEVYYIVNFF